MKTTLSRFGFLAISVGALWIGMSGCSHSQPVSREAYAQLKTSKTFEYDFPKVWKGIEIAFSSYTGSKRDPEEVGILEMKKISERSIESDWIYTRSTDQYVEYQVNDLPRRQYVQTRVKYRVEAKRAMGGVNVNVIVQQEVERLKKNGDSDGYSKTDPSSSLGSDMLHRVERGILSAPPTETNN